MQIASISVVVLNHSVQTHFFHWTVPCYFPLTGFSRVRPFQSVSKPAGKVGRHADGH
jgi:hypothetical protein